MIRHICCRPEGNLYKPAGIPMGRLAMERLTLDEFEAIRLADYEGLYHEQAAKEMGISRATFGRILEEARKKLASAIVNGHAFLIEGGPVTFHEHGRGCCNRIIFEENAIHKQKEDTK